MKCLFARVRTSLFVVLLLCSGTAFAAQTSPAEPFLEQLSAVQTQWAQINYRSVQSAKEDAFKSLADQSAALVKGYDQHAEVHIWHGIVLSSWAGARGGLGALDLAKQAKAEYERALAIDRQALQGSALASLGVLYFKVPGWPLGFGDDKKAEALLKEALQVNPQGIDPNYFYADFLLDQGRPAESLPYAQQALQAPARAGRELADQGRRDEALALVQKIKAKRP